MLDTSFHRPPGDVGNALTWPFPTCFRSVAGATARRVVDSDDDQFLDAFVAAGEVLKEAGAIGLITSCGFLARHQQALSSRLSLPIATSSLLQIPMVSRCLPARQRVGVITYDDKALTRRHFEGVGADPDTPTIGLPPWGVFHGVIERGLAYQPSLLEEELMATVRVLLDRHRDIGALVFECTNLPPFSNAARRDFGLPVFDVLTMGTWFYRGLAGTAGHVGGEPDA